MRVCAHRYKFGPNEMEEAYRNKGLVSQGRCGCISEHIQQEGRQTGERERAKDKVRGGAKVGKVSWEMRR